MPKQSGNGKHPTPPYVSFGVFLEALDKLCANGLPNRIDHSLWPSISPLVRGQLVTAFRFLRLIDGQGHPQQSLQTLLTPDDQAKKEALAQILRDAYPDIFKLSLERTTPKQLEEAFSSYPIRGSTLRRAIAFFLAAARYADIPLAPHLLPKRGGGGLSRRRRNASVRVKQSSHAPETVQNQILSSGRAALGESKTIQLRSGGTLTLTLSASFFNMDTRDRDFVFRLLDQLRAYEENEGGAGV